MKIRAPAKINLRLRVVGKRSDGYHLLDTIMVPVSLYDEIEIKKLKLRRRSRPMQPALTVTCDPPSLPQGEGNLVYQAARLIMNQSGVAAALHIHIRKRIPVGAGLGGGSTDAAKTLVGLNRMLQLGLSSKRLEKLGALLGADVPFFIQAKPARARGIGDHLQTLPRLPKLSLVILYPKFAVSTAWVYRNLRFKLTKPTVKFSIVSLLGNINRIIELLVNDLEAVTIARHPKIGTLKKKLIQAGALGALMSGSGSSVFGIFTSHQQARQAFNRLRREKMLGVFLVRTLS